MVPVSAVVWNWRWRAMPVCVRWMKKLSSACREVQLGLLPGSGGTQRLPRLIGAPKALDMMLTGRSIRAKQALKMGLVDDAVPYSILLQTALERVAKGRKSRPPLPWQARLAGGPVGKSLLFHFVRKQIWAKTHGNYPATTKIIDVVKTGLDQGSGNGYQAEAKAFGELVMTSESAALRGLFFASTALKKKRAVMQNLCRCAVWAFSVVA